MTRQADGWTAPQSGPREQVVDRQRDVRRQIARRQPVDGHVNALDLQIDDAV